MNLYVYAHNHKIIHTYGVWRCMLLLNRAEPNENKREKRNTQSFILNLTGADLLQVRMVGLEFRIAAMHLLHVYKCDVYRQECIC